MSGTGIQGDEILSRKELLKFDSAPNTKSYAFMFVHYGSPCHLLDNIPNVCHVFSILHDKDTKEGSLERVTPHYHTILTFKNPRYLSAMRKVAQTLASKYGQNYFVQACHSLSKAAEYALHQTTECLEDENKHMYTYQDALCDNDAFWSKVIDGSDDYYNAEFMRDLLTLTPIKLAYKYGKEYMRNYLRYDDFRKFVLEAYDGKLEYLMNDIDLSGNKLNFREKLNSYYMIGELKND